MRRLLTPDVYPELDRLGGRLAGGCQEPIDAHDLPKHTVTLGAKGCVTFRADRLLRYRDFLECDAELQFASWLYLFNRGIYLSPGEEEQWTLSVVHGEDEG